MPVTFGTHTSLRTANYWRMFKSLTAKSNFMLRRNSKGPRTEPCVTPEITGRGVDSVEVSPFKTTD